MGDLKSKNRAHVKTKNFGLPEKARTPSAKKESGNYPMPDKEHASNAKARAKQQLKQGKLSRTDYDKIVRKADKILGKKD